MPFLFPAFSPARSISNREVVDDKRKAAERDREKEGGGTCDSQTQKKRKIREKRKKSLGQSIAPRTFILVEAVARYLLPSAI